MQFEIYNGNEFINSIESSEEYCIKYCNSMGFTYRKREHQASEPQMPNPTEDEIRFLGQWITALDLERVSMGQEITELQLNQLEGGATANA